MKTAGFLGIMVAAHAYQAELGMNDFHNHVDHLQTGHTEWDVPMAATDVPYTLINAAVTVQQVALMGQLNAIRKRKQERNLVRQQPPLPAPVHRAEAESAGAKSVLVSGAVGLTLLGQSVFIGSYIDGLVDRHEMDCIENADQTLHKIYEMPGSEQFAGSFRERYAEYCGVKPTDLLLPTPQDAGHTQVIVLPAS